MDTFDVAVIGAGPVGSVAAHALASQGREVLLLEANPHAARRFAGEWLHPPGVEILDDLGLAPLDCASQHKEGDGFVVYPDDGGAPVKLPYVEGRAAATFEHRELVEELREKAANQPRVDYRPFTRATKVEPGRVDIQEARSDETVSIRADTIVGADGYSSVARKALGFDDEAKTVSYMGALALKDFDMPFEGFGHVVLGGPGPVLLYRVGSDEVRVSIDVPVERSDLRRDHAALHDAIVPMLPNGIAERIGQEIDEGNIRWAATRFRPHIHYGRDGIALVGDAVGTYHPMTAVGMTSGFQDVKTLLEASDIEDYRRRRSKASHVPELLSSSLYKIFRGEEGVDGSDKLRRAIYDTWRNSPDLCRNTMRLLSGAETRGPAFSMTYGRIAVRAFWRMAFQQSRRRGVSGIRDVVDTFMPWARWPLAPLLPQPVSSRLRQNSSIETPMKIR